MKHVVFRKLNFAVLLSILNSVLFSFSFAKEITIRGLVVNESGLPISNALVHAKTMNVSSITDGNGYFEVKGFDTYVHSFKNKVDAPEIFYNKSNFYARLAHSSSIKIIVYDIKGRIVYGGNSKLYAAGEKRIDFDPVNLGGGIYYVSVQCENSIYTFIYTNVNRLKNNVHSIQKVIHSTNSILRKAAADTILTTLTISAENFYSKDVPIFSYENNEILNIVLFPSTSRIVRFDSKGGSVIDSQTVPFMNRIILPDDPSRNYYEMFNGWYIDSLYSKVWDFENDFITQDTTLYSKWVIINPVLTKSVIVGGHNNAQHGMSVDFDNDRVLLSSQAVQDSSGVDLLYTFSAYSQKPILMNPFYAYNNSGITAFVIWKNPEATKFHKVSVDVDHIYSSEQIKALFNLELSNHAGRMVCEAGDLFVVKTDLGKYILLKVESVSVDASGTAVLKYLR